MEQAWKPAGLAAQRAWGITDVAVAHEMKMLIAEQKEAHKVGKPGGVPVEKNKAAVTALFGDGWEVLPTGSFRAMSFSHPLVRGGKKLQNLQAVGRELAHMLKGHTPTAAAPAGDAMPAVGAFGAGPSSAPVTPSHGVVADADEEGIPVLEQVNEMLGDDGVLMRFARCVETVHRTVAAEGGAGGADPDGEGPQDAVPLLDAIKACACATSPRPLRPQAVATG